MKQLLARCRYFVATLLFLLTTAMSSGGAVFASANSSNSNSATSPLYYTGQGYPISEQCGAGTDTPAGTMLFIFTYGGNYNPTNVTLHGITVLSQQQNGNEMHIFTPYSDNLTSLEQNVNVTWDGSVGNAQLVISHGCPAPNTPVTPGTVTYVDLCGTSNDTYTIPTTTGVTYEDASNTVLTAGTHNYTGGNTLVVHAVAQTGYTLTGTTSWNLAFTNATCTQTVTPATVTYVDNCGVNTDTFTIPTSTGVTYEDAANNVLTAGTHNYTGGNTLTVHAVAQTGYTLTGTTSWNLAFTNVACLVTVTPGTVSSTDLCGTSNDTYTIPTTTGVTYMDAQNNVLTAGTHNYTGGNDFTVHAVAQTGYQLTGTTSWTLHFTNEPCVVIVTPTAPTPSTPNCEVQTLTVTLPAAQAGVIWIPNSSTTLQPGGTVTYTATAAQGYQFASGAQTQWTFTNTFNPATCNCGCNEHHEVTAAEVTFKDVCGTDHDTFTIPTTDHVKYFVNGSPIAATAGTYNGQGTVTVTAVADSGYTLVGQDSWTHTFTNVPCVVKVRPPRVVFEDLCGTQNDTFTIPSKTGVEYMVNGHVVAAGTYKASDYEVNGTVTVTAVALPGYMLKGHVHSWSEEFSDEECGQGGETTPVVPSAVTFTDVCATANDTYTIPTTTGVTYLVNGVPTVAGTYAATGTVTVTAEAQTGFVLNGTASWTHTFTNEACAGSGGQVLGESTVIFTPTPGKGAEVQAAQLANTGQNSLLSSIVAFVIAVSAIMVYAFAPKRQLGN